MADHLHADASEESGRKVAPADYDGRFGNEFDDEISTGPIIQIVIGLIVICFLGIGITLGMDYIFDAQQTAFPTSPVDGAEERRLPYGPQLQSDPEGELEVLRAEQKAHLNSYGWLDEAAERVHIPIDTAIDLMLEQSGEPTSEPAPEAEAPAAAAHGSAEHAP